MDEIIYLLSGEMEQWVEKEKRILKPGDSAYIQRGIVHGCYNMQLHALIHITVLIAGSSCSHRFNGKSSCSTI